MPQDPLNRAWMALMLLSGASTLVAILVTREIASTLAGVTILLLAWMKARVILSRYLGLWQAPSWRAGFDSVIALFCLLLVGLYLIPALSS